MTNPDRRTHPDRRDASVYLSEVAGAAARVWVLAGAKPAKLYFYVEHEWVEISLKHNGEAEQPRRREADKESDYLAPQESKLDALTSDRSIDA